MIQGSRQDEDSPDDDRAAALESLPEGDCVVLAMHGSRPAQEELVRRHLGAVYRLCLKLLRDPDRATDATQESFLRAFQALSGFDRTRSFRAWVCAIAWNFVRDDHRRRKLRRAVSLSAPGADGEGGIDPADWREEAAGARLEREESAVLMDEALGRLEPETRALIVLREMEGLSYLEIAEMFRLKLGTVKSRVHRARMELKDVLLALRPGWFTG
jgi:RNA polymerase sigma-70 factor (ECF subfamily)